MKIEVLIPTHILLRVLSYYSLSYSAITAYLATTSIFEAPRYSSNQLRYGTHNIIIVRL